MRFYALLPTVLATSAMMSTIGAQQPRVYRVGPGTVVGRGDGFNIFGDQPRAVIGITTTNASSSRDTLGVLVSTVRAGSPAEKAGIEEGNRIASVNGVSLKLSPADVGDDQMAGVLSRRLSRELDKVKPGDEVTLQVYANGQTKTVRIKTVAPEDLYESSRVSRNGRSSDRPTLGLDLAITGSARDTLGVFVMGVEDGSPAAKAGIEEGSRIASINGVDVRGRRGDEDDFVLRTSNVNRLEREISRLEPGADVDLRVWFNGQYRNVKMKAARMGDLPRRNRSVTILGGDNFVPPAAFERLDAIPNMIRDLDMPRISDNVRRALDGVGFGSHRVSW
jgi:S1-C subfamily serine protease